MRVASRRLEGGLKTWCLRASFACAGCGLAMSLEAAVPDFTLPAGSVREALLPFEVNGRPTLLQSFMVPQPPARVAAALIPQIHGRPVLLGLKDGVAISWSDKSWLWSVRLRGQGPDRTAGTVSGADMAGGATSATHRPAWLPADAKLALDVSTRQADASATQQVYLHDGPMSRLSSLVSRRLQSCGWSQVWESAGAMHWRRAGARLDLVLVPASGGSGLVLHLVEPARAKTGEHAC